MDIYDFTRGKFEKFNQKKLLTYTILIASILIVFLILFIVRVFVSANNGTHIFSYNQKQNEKRIQEEEERQRKILEDPDAEELYNKLFVEKDLSF